MRSALRANFIVKDPDRIGARPAAYVISPTWGKSGEGHRTPSGALRALDVRIDNTPLD